LEVRQPIASPAHAATALEIWQPVPGSADAAAALEVRQPFASPAHAPTALEVRLLVRKFGKRISLTLDSAYIFIVHS
jgi:hypothetical protein